MIISLYRAMVDLTVYHCQIAISLFEYDNNDSLRECVIWNVPIYDKLQTCRQNLMQLASARYWMIKRIWNVKSNQAVTQFHQLNVWNHFELHCFVVSIALRQVSPCHQFLMPHGSLFVKYAADVWFIEEPPSNVDRLGRKSHVIRYNTEVNYSSLGNSYEV